MKRIEERLISEWLTAHGSWSTEGGKLHKVFVFGDFQAAFAWMTRVAERAEQMNHHPEWLNVYSHVTVWLQTHDAEGLTTRDLELAETMDNLLV